MVLVALPFTRDHDAEDDGVYLADAEASLTNHPVGIFEHWQVGVSRYTAIATRTYGS